MGRALAVVALALVVCFGVLGGLVFLEREEDRVAVDSALAEEISRALTLANESPDPVAFAELTDFAWDRLLIVEKGTPWDEVSAALGSEFRGDLPYDAESSEIFVFARGDRLARFADYRGPLSFEGLDRPIDAMTPGEAVFAVRSGVIRPDAGG